MKFYTFDEIVTDEDLLLLSVTLDKEQLEQLKGKDKYITVEGFVKVDCDDAVRPFVTGKGKFLSVRSSAGLSCLAGYSFTSMFESTSDLKNDLAALDTLTAYLENYMIIYEGVR